MSVQLTLTFEELAELAEQLQPAEKLSLIQRLQEDMVRRRLTHTEFSSVLDDLVIDLGAPSPDFSFSREDWYADDGR